ncbi:MAG: hypothetical protein COS14_09485 [Bacteroidetes bacterium CG02_land_8_20_14_3_00_31_25]|nr:MAG: hypothetical protein COX07_08960 [Bacteroidetes bacterium CG23_combo_of_CG06-09_8_20_14_all_32_9]PIV58455.1 MAG: hypothetical protein COS14_09485 [Bacteroidetes bacterium CG02_land_8_20_14_3_00_31_25]
MTKQVFNIILFTNNENIGNKGYIKYRKVYDLCKFKLFAEKKYPNWKFLNVYDNKTKHFIETVKHV